jgi:hypothetical protein
MSTRTSMFTDDDTMPRMNAPATAHRIEPNPPIMLVPPSKVTTRAMITNKTLMTTDALMVPTTVRTVE